MNLCSRTFFVTGAIMCLAFLPLACAPESGKTGTTPTPVVTEEAVATPAPATAAPTSRLATEPASAEREIRLTPSLRVSPERVPSSIPGPVTGEVPEELLVAILKDAETRGTAKGEDLAITRAEAVTWNDGSLGCPQPGMMYTQATVDGYWVVIKGGSEEFDYRATKRGSFTLCERGLPLPATTPGSDASKPSE